MPRPPYLRERHHEKLKVLAVLVIGAALTANAFLAALGGFGFLK